MDVLISIVFIVNKFPINYVHIPIIGNVTLSISCRGFMENKWHTYIHTYIQPGSQLSATWGSRCIVLSGVWTEYSLSTAQKHNSVNHLNSQAPGNISLLNSHYQLKSQKLSSAGMTDCYNRLSSLSQKMLIVTRWINEYMNLPVSRVT
jgi:hypothetical protein